MTLAQIILLFALSRYNRELWRFVDITFSDCWALTPDAFVLINKFVLLFVWLWIHVMASITIEIVLVGEFVVFVMILPGSFDLIFVYRVRCASNESLFWMEFSLSVRWVHILGLWANWDLIVIHHNLVGCLLPQLFQLEFILLQRVSILIRLICVIVFLIEIGTERFGRRSFFKIIIVLKEGWAG